MDVTQEKGKEKCPDCGEPLYPADNEMLGCVRCQRVYRREE